MKTRNGAFDYFEKDETKRERSSIINAVSFSKEAVEDSGLSLLKYCLIFKDKNMNKNTVYKL